MRGWLASIFTIAIVASSTAFGSDRAFAKAADPTLTVHGALVRASEHDDFAPAREGATVVAGSTVRSSGARAAQLDIAEGVSIRLAPGTTLGIGSTAWLPSEHPGASLVRALRVSLTAGEIDVVVHDPRGALGVTVLLPAGASVALWRGSANVSLAPAQAAIALYDGMAIAGSASRWQPLTAGKGLVLSTSTGLATRPIPASPEWSNEPGSPSPFALARGSDGGVVGAAWAATEGAASYRVELARAAETTGDVVFGTPTAPVFRSDPLPPGTYTLQVRAISPDGIVGPPSTQTTLRVAHVKMPAYAFVAPDGTIVLPERQSLTIDDPGGLEMATVEGRNASDEALFWATASSKLSPGALPRQEVRIRRAGSHVTTSFVLAHRALRARISFGPKHPHWPANPVDIVVRVDDPSGYLDPAREPIDIDTRFDIDHVDVRWSHTGNTWTARIPPETSPGPWVIRVDVKDSTGSTIGASWIDVDGPAADAAVLRAAPRR